MTPVILCVDDEVTILDTLKEQLVRHFGSEYAYELAESAEEAWEIGRASCRERVYSGV